MASKKQDYGNESISALKGADRVRKRPGVIFGSDGLDGCEHAVFEILSNSIDEAREGHGGCPVDWNEKEQRYNWELVFCELYAGGKYDNEDGDNYEFSLGLNGLGSCATQYASRYMDVTVWRDGFEYSLHFERGEIVGELGKRPLPKNQSKKTGTRTRWLPDLDVFTDGTRRRRALPRRSSSMKTGSPTMSWNWRGRNPSPRRCFGRRRSGAGTGRTSRSTR